MNSADSILKKSLQTFLRPILPFWENSEINAIIINPSQGVWLDKKGSLECVDVTFSNEDLFQTIRHISQRLGVLVNEDSPLLHHRFLGGEKVSILLPPLSLEGPILSLEKEVDWNPSLEELVSSEFLSAPSASLLKQVLELNQSILLVGNEDSGASALLRALLNELSDSERLLYLGNRELEALSGKKYLSVSTASIENWQREAGGGSESLFSTLSSFRPHRIITDKLEGEYTYSFLQLLSGGVSSIALTEAHSLLHSLHRLESYCLQEKREYSLLSVRSQISSSFQFVAFCRQFPDGSQRLTEISEVLPLSNQGDFRFVPLVKGRYLLEKGTPVFVSSFTSNSPSFLEDNFSTENIKQQNALSPREDRKLITEVPEDNKVQEDSSIIDDREPISESLDYRVSSVSPADKIDKPENPFTPVSQEVDLGIGKDRVGILDRSLSVADNSLPPLLDDLDTVQRIREENSGLVSNKEDAILSSLRKSVTPPPSAIAQKPVSDLNEGIAGGDNSSSASVEHVSISDSAELSNAMTISRQPPNRGDELSLAQIESEILSVSIPESGQQERREVEPSDVLDFSDIVGEELSPPSVVSETDLLVVRDELEKQPPMQKRKLSTDMAPNPNILTEVVARNELSFGPNVGFYDDEETFHGTRNEFIQSQQGRAVGTIPDSPSVENMPGFAQPSDVGLDGFISPNSNVNPKSSNILVRRGNRHSQVGRSSSQVSSSAAIEQRQPAHTPRTPAEQMQSAHTPRTPAEQIHVQGPPSQELHESIKRKQPPSIPSPFADPDGVHASSNPLIENDLHDETLIRGRRPPTVPPRKK